jgi:hypothetical protein
MPIMISSKRPRSVDSDEEDEFLSGPVGKVSSVFYCISHALH